MEKHGVYQKTANSQIIAGSENTICIPSFRPNSKLLYYEILIFHRIIFNTLKFQTGYNSHLKIGPSTAPGTDLSEMPATKASTSSTDW